MELDLSVYGDEFNRRYGKREYLWDDFFNAIYGKILLTTPKEIYDRDDFTDLDTLKNIRDQLVKIEIKDFTDDIYDIYHDKMVEILDRYRNLPRLRKQVTV